VSHDSEWAQENIDVYRWIRDNGHSEFVVLANECDLYAQGHQWDAGVKARLARRKKPTLTINKVLATCATLFGQQIERRGDISFRASSGGAPDTARVLDKLWINFVQQQNYDWMESMAFADGVIRSRGFLDLRMVFDDNMRGDPALTYLNSKDVGLYPGDHGADPDNWTGVMVTRWMSARDISEMYGVKSEDVLLYADATELESDFSDWKRDSFGHPWYDTQILSNEQRAKYRMFRVLERQEWEYKNVTCFVDQPTGEVREVPQSWDNERIQLAIAQFGYAMVKRRVKKINWVVTVGNMLLHKAISPYKHFTPVPYFPFLIGGKPVGIVEQLRDPQNLLNKTLSQELHIVAGIANSGYKVRSGALANMTPEQLQERGGEDGIVIEVTNNLNEIEKLQPNQVPTGLDRLSYKASEAMQEISLVNDSLQGLNRSDESGVAIDKKAQHGSGALTPIYTSLDQTRRVIARNWLDLIQEFVTEERVFHTTGAAKTAKTEEVAVNQEQQDGSFLNDLTLGEYSIHISNVPARDSYDMNQFDILMQMMRQGAPIPWSEAVSSLSILENKDEIVDYLKGQEGRNDPSEAEQRRQQLDERMLTAQALDKESSAAVKQAQAQKAMMEAQNPKQGGKDPQIEMFKMQHDASVKERDSQNKMAQAQQASQLKEKEMQGNLQLEHQKAMIDMQMAQAKMEFEKQKMQQELEFARQKHELEIAKLRATIQSDQIKAQTQQAVAQSQMTMQRESAQQQMTLQQQSAQVDAASAEHQASIQERQANMQMSHAEKQAEMENKQAESKNKFEADRSKQQLTHAEQQMKLKAQQQKQNVAKPTGASKK
jgi:hypothetical protein